MDRFARNISINADCRFKKFLIIAGDIAIKNIKLNMPIEEFNKNIRRFQLLTQAALASAESLTTDQRARWMAETSYRLT